MSKRKIAKTGLAIGILALCWLLKSAGLINVGDTPRSDVGQSPVTQQAAEAPVQPVEKPARSEAATAKTVEASETAADAIVRDGQYCDKESVAAYIRKFNGRLPSNYITKDEARALGWQGGPLEPFAPGKSIGGDRFGNYERKLPDGRYKECDIDTRGKPRGAKRLIYTHDGKVLYYTKDHYETFEKVVPR